MAPTFFKMSPNRVFHSLRAFPACFMVVKSRKQCTPLKTVEQAQTFFIFWFLGRIRSFLWRSGAFICLYNGRITRTPGLGDRSPQQAMAMTPTNVSTSSTQTQVYLTIYEHV